MELAACDFIAHKLRRTQTARLLRIMAEQEGKSATQRFPWLPDSLFASLQCPICVLLFDDDQHKPVKLCCESHIVCEHCIRDYLTRNGGEGKRPLCPLACGHELATLSELLANAATSVAGYASSTALRSLLMSYELPPCALQVVRSEMLSGDGQSRATVFIGRLNGVKLVACKQFPPRLRSSKFLPLSFFYSSFA